MFAGQLERLQEFKNIWHTFRNWFLFFNGPRGLFFPFTQGVTVSQLSVEPLKSYSHAWPCKGHLCFSQETMLQFCVILESRATVVTTVRCKNQLREWKSEEQEKSMRKPQQHPQPQQYLQTTSQHPSLWAFEADCLSAFKHRCIHVTLIRIPPNYVAMYHWQLSYCITHFYCSWQH